MASPGAPNDEETEQGLTVTETRRMIGRGKDGARIF